MALGSPAKSDQITDQNSESRAVSPQRSGSRMLTIKVILETTNGVRCKFHSKTRWRWSLPVAGRQRVGGRRHLRAAPIGIHLRILKNDKKPPICAFLCVCNKLPKLRALVDSHGPVQQNQQLDLVGGCNAVKSRHSFWSSGTFSDEDAFEVAMRNGSNRFIPALSSRKLVPQLRRHGVTKCPPELADDHGSSFGAFGAA